jgi:hypothetical protein
MQRYPLEISDADLSRLKREKNKHIDNINELEALILPDYKPKEVHLKDGYLAREYQVRGKDVFMKTKRLLCGDDLGLGKAEWVENSIFTPTGTKKMKHIGVGDFVIGSDGRAIRVSGVFPQGEKEMYRVSFNDGASVIVCEEHLWAVRASSRKRRKGGFLTLTTKQMLDKSLEIKTQGVGANRRRTYKLKTYYKSDYKSSKGVCKWYIPITKPVQFNEQAGWIDPYLLGALIGDGGITNSLVFTSADNEMLENIEGKLPDKICLKKKAGSKYDYYLSKKTGKKGQRDNPLTIYLRHYGLFGKKSDAKFIPAEYKFNSVENRISLLQGLMDTDGCVMLNKRKINSTTGVTSSILSYTTTSKLLADDVIFLVQSLGGIALLSDKIPTYSYKGEKKKGKRAYTLVMNIPEGINPFRLKRKADVYFPKAKYKPFRYISNIEAVGKLEAKCIKVEAEDHLYLTENFIVTHNTLIGIISFLEPGTLPAIVTVQSHLTKQWKDEIEKFTELKVHVIKGTRPYSLPPADVYITKYTCLAGWSDLFKTRFFKMAVFDEAQELRHNGTAKYNGALALSEGVDYCLGMSATPIYNYGIEIYNVLSLIKPECLGYRDDFLREWSGGYGDRIIKDPVALGTFLRDGFLLLRRTRAEVGRELPPINTIVHTVSYDENEVHKADALARQLALKVTTGSFMERGQAARELDMLARQVTGVSKARGVAEYVKILLENNVPVILAGWHRECYKIWLEELAEYKPVMYTGSESPKQKEDSKQAFLKGETNLFIISLRSGVGLDGLQARCNTVVIGELDWSPKVHDQLIARSDRDGQKEQVTAIFLVSDYGSDPVIIDLLGLKSSQSHNIIDPLKAVANKHTDESRIKILAQKYLEKKHRQKEEENAV